MSVLIIGAKGNMGRRYGSVLSYLDKDWTGVDADHSKYQIREAASRADGIIIATPTDTHAALISLCADLKKPILCEKPISKYSEEMARLLQEVKSNNTNLTMVYQYKELIKMPSIGWSYYNYWNTGKDGLVWDCIQIIALARGDISLQNDSPIWHCRINGVSLKLSDMDRAYIKMMARWLDKPGQDISEIKDIHQKVDEFNRSVISAID